MKKLILILTLILLSISLVQAQDDVYHLKLLAVQDTGEKHIGSDADIFLELKEGTGRVFLDTFPVTKMDTQISTRFAKEIACKHFNLDCNRYDFIYTIKAKSNIIGGPSAGAAISALTAIAMLDLNYDEDVTITGTINSGGIVGPVGGVKEKLEAASIAGLKKVMISKGGNIPNNFNETNSSIISIDYVTYGEENLSLEVVEVTSIDEVVFQLTGIDLNHKEYVIEENPEYSRIMEDLKSVLCSRTDKIESELKEKKISINKEIREKVNIQKGNAKNATQNNDFYSAASYCFGTNIDLRREYYQNAQLPENSLQKQISLLNEKVSSLEKDLKEEKIETISDLQTLMVVKERISDVKEQINKLRETTSISEKRNLVAYAEERFFSAVSWTKFFAMTGKKFIVDEEQLRQSCLTKVFEAEQRKQYTQLYVNNFLLHNIEEKLESAKKAQQKGDFELCLITASQAKSDANAILSSLGLHENAVNEFILSKQKAVERVIAENSKEGIFPILGYSYYQYAQSLQEDQKYTALVYMEYALEMSELSIYFPEDTEFRIPSLPIDSEWLYFVLGVIVGLAIPASFFLAIKPKNRRKKRKRK